MSNSRHKEAILSPSLSRITKRIRSSITEHFLHGMFYILPPARQNVLPMSPERSVTYVSGRSFFHQSLKYATRAGNKSEESRYRFGSAPSNLKTRRNNAETKIGKE